MSNKARFSPGTQLGGYQLVAFLGSGTFGEVYKATKPNDVLKLNYAIKIPFPQYLDEDSLSHEAKIGFNVSGHKNVLRFVGAELVADGPHQGELLLVSEFCNGGSLRDLLKANPNGLPESQVVVLLQQACAGVAHLHSAGVFHRDLKPDNLLLHEGILKIGDFGISRLTEKSRSYSSNEAGTVSYMSPEALDGVYSPGVDLWALGVILHELLTGKLPFVGETKFVLMKQILMDEPSALPSRVSSRVREAVAGCLVKEEKARISSASALGALLQAPAPVVKLASPAPELDWNNLAKRLALRPAAKGEGDIVAPLPDLVVRPSFGLTVAEAKLLPSTHPAPLTLAEYKAQMVQLPGGTFQMGSNSGRDNEKPVHSVTLSPFVMGRTPVTVAMWQEFCQAAGRTMPKLPNRPVWKDGWASVLDHPMVNVNWADCHAYADWAGLKLPTEAQWEYAARGGLESKNYPWGDTMDNTKVWSRTPSGTKGTAPVSRSNNIFVNGYGLVDLSGNVEEWCADWFAPYSSETQTEPTGASSGTFRVLRGGFWNLGFVYADNVRCADRVSFYPSFAYYFRGFRLSSSAL